MPFITEELWQQVAPLAGKTGDTISLQPYPVADPSIIDPAAIADIEWVKQVVMGVRRIRSEMNINPGRKLPLYCAQTSGTDLQRLKAHENLLISMARLEKIDILTPSDEEPESAVALVDQMKLLIPMAGIIDKDAEIKRLDKQLEKLTSQVENLNRKLANKGFTDKAPEKVVAVEQQKLADARMALDELQAQRQKIAAM